MILIILYLVSLVISYFCIRGMYIFDSDETHRMVYIFICVALVPMVNVILLSIGVLIWYTDTHSGREFWHSTGQRAKKFFLIGKKK